MDHDAAHIPYFVFQDGASIPPNDSGDTAHANVSLTYANVLLATKVTKF
jgi:hypothetical protein